MEEFIERRIVTGLIVSTTYLQQIHKIWDPRLLASGTAKMLSGWCFEYFLRYHKAPLREIESIYTHKLKDGLSGERAEAIEEILDGLSDEYIRSQFNEQYLLDETFQYFRERKLRLLSDDIRGEIDTGNLVEAESLAAGYAPVSNQVTYLDPFSKEVRPVVERIFSERAAPLIQFPAALGKFWNHEFIRSRFVAFLAPEKRGKSYRLMDIAMRGARNGCRVAYFQAGDMLEEEQTLRFAEYLTKRSISERYCDELYIPQVDCMYNQTNECDVVTRQSKTGIHVTEAQLDDVTYEMLVEKHSEFPNHRNCYNCAKLRGTVWFEKRGKIKPLNEKDAYIALRRFEKKYKARFRMSTHPADTLTVLQMKGLLDLWEKQDGFVADIAIVDYADVLASEPDCKQMASRDQHNATWLKLRSLSQQKHVLLITATQSDAESYEREILRRRNFSEDKRKYGHVTSMWGLNQNNEEKRIGIMRINDLVQRHSDDYDEFRPVTVLQRLEIGRPFLGSYK